MANFAIASSQETLEKADQIMKLYYRDGDKKEDTLLRILSVAEADSVRGTHPELEKNLKSIDATISALINGINGIVSGQDNQIASLKEKLENALQEKRSILESTKIKTDEAAEIKRLSVESVKTAQEEIEKIKQNTTAEIERAKTDRDHALQERDDARAISEEKAASNDLLMRQMTSMQEDVEAYKILISEYELLKNNYSKLSDEVKDANRTIEAEKREHSKEIETLKQEHAQALKTLQSQADLDMERAVNDTTRTLQQQIYSAEKEAARLQTQVDSLNSQLSTEKKSNKEYQNLIRELERSNSRLQAQIEHLEAQLQAQKS